MPFVAPHNASSLEDPEHTEIQLHFHGKIIRAHRIQSFIRHVWGFDAAAIEPVLPQLIHTFVSHPYLAGFRWGITKSTRPRILDAGKSLCEIIQDIHAQLDRLVKPNPSRQPNKFLWCTKDSSEECTLPAIIYGSRDDSWCTMGSFIHVFKDEVSLDGPTGSTQVAPNSPFKFQLLPRPSFKRSAPDFMLPPVSKRQKVGGVRPFGDPKAAWYAKDRRPLTPREVPPAMFIHSMLSHGVRLFATGIAVHNTVVTLYYGDRYGLIQSASFDMMTSPALFVTVIAALANADSATLGIPPMLSLSSHPKAEGISRSEIHMGWAGYGKGLGGSWHFVTDLNDVRPVHFAHGAVGRGTTVIPVRAMSKNNQGPYSNPIKTGGKKLVCKITWPQTNTPAENVIIDVIRHDLGDLKPQALKHVVKLICSKTWTPNELGLPRTSIGTVFGAPERVCRAMVMVSYRPIVDLISAADFQRVFIHAMKAHYWVWEHAGILHRDISHNNIMFYYEGYHAVGVLCDFDLARHRASISGDIFDDAMMRKRIDLGEDLQLPDRSHEVVGTQQYIACELLAPVNVPVQTYRHDLESFFYLLCWFCAVHDPVHRSFGTIPAWQNEDFIMVGAVKSLFLTSSTTEGIEDFVDPVFKNAHENYIDIIDQWVFPLRDLFLVPGVKVILAHLELKDIEGTITGGELEDLGRLKELILELDTSEPTFFRFMDCIDVDVTDV